MKLVQIYSNKKNFKKVILKDGLNLVLGKINHEENLETDSHNLGKTTLIDIIDFLLLKEIDKNHFLKKDVFKEYVFFLEIELNNGKYLTIRRGVERNTKISIKLHSKKYQNYVNENVWDYLNLALTTKHEAESPKNILNNLLGFNVLEGYDYRQTINYFLRTQYDYADVFKLSKFKGKHIDWKPFLFELLGFSRTNVVKKYSLEEEKNKQEDKIKEIEKEFEIDVAEVDKINGLIQIKEDEKEEIRNTIDRFDFYMKERGLNKKVIEEIENDISNLNSLEYDLKYDINKIIESLETNDDFDLNETLEIFTQAEIFFNTQLKKSYEELIEFNKKITSERKKHLSENLNKKKIQLEETEAKLVELNKKRVEILKVLNEKDTFKKFKNYQTDLVTIEKEIERLQLNLENIDVVKKQKKVLEDIEKDLKIATNDLEKEITNSNKLYKDIRKDYYSFLKSVISKPGILSIKPNSNGNVEFKAEIANDKDELTSEDRGFSYKKILCACFDIALLKNYYGKSFYRFIYHDGCLESLDPRKKIQYLNLIENICAEYDVQYILTLLESDIPIIKEKNTKYKFKNANVAVALSDDEDGTGTLFGFSF